MLLHRLDQKYLKQKQFKLLWLSLALFLVLNPPTEHMMRTHTPQPLPHSWPLDRVPVSTLGISKMNNVLLLREHVLNRLLE